MIRPPSLPLPPLRFVRTRQHTPQHRRRRCANARSASALPQGQLCYFVLSHGRRRVARPDTHGLCEYTTNRHMQGVHATLNKRCHENDIGKTSVSFFQEKFCFLPDTL